MTFPRHGLLFGNPETYSAETVEIIINLTSVTKHEVQINMIDHSNTLRKNA